VIAQRPELVWSLDGRYPEYFIYGPLVFSPATLEHLALVGNPAAARGMSAFFHVLQSPLVRKVGQPPSAEREELVIVASPFFPHPLTAGYDNPSGNVLARVNGTSIRSLKHLVALLRDLKDEFVTFEFEQQEREALVFARKDLVEATEAILTDNGIRAQASAGLLEIWDGKRGK